MSAASKDHLVAADPSVPVDRIPLYEVYMRMAEELAKRSTCVRLQVGTVVTDQQLENVLAIGYNGNARGLPNKCDSAVPGNCGCIHSEMNALVKALGNMRDKVVFVSASPCVMCAKLIINSGVTHVFYRKAYRDPSGVEVLQREIATINPDPASFRSFPDAQVMVNGRAAERVLLAERAYAPPAAAEEDEELVDTTGENPVPVPFVSASAFRRPPPAPLARSKDAMASNQCEYCGGGLPGTRHARFVPHFRQPREGDHRRAGVGGASEA